MLLLRTRENRRRLRLTLHLADVPVLELKDQCKLHASQKSVEPYGDENHLERRGLSSK